MNRIKYISRAIILIFIFCLNLTNGNSQVTVDLNSFDDLILRKIISEPMYSCKMDLAAENLWITRETLICAIDLNRMEVKFSGEIANSVNFTSPISRLLVGSEGIAVMIFDGAASYDRRISQKYLFYLIQEDLSSFRDLTFTFEKGNIIPIVDTEEFTSYILIGDSLILQSRGLDGWLICKNQFKSQTHSVTQFNKYDLTIKKRYIVQAALRDSSNQTGVYYRFSVDGAYLFSTLEYPFEFSNYSQTFIIDNQINTIYLNDLHSFNTKSSSWSYKKFGTTELHDFDFYKNGIYQVKIKSNQIIIW